MNAQITCRICDHPLETTFVNLGMSPLANSYLKPEQLNSSESFYPLHVFVCGQCYLVQLPEHQSPIEIFSDYAYFSSFSKSWLDHARRYVEDITAKKNLTERSLVVELASNDGYLLQYFKEHKIPILGIEPAQNIARVANEKGIPTRSIFFNADTAKKLVEEGCRADLLVGNNVLAHVPNVRSFVAGMKILLKDDGLITLEFPYVVDLMRENQFDTIYHEHFSYFSLGPVRRLFANQGLDVFDVEHLPTHGGSLRIYAHHADQEAPWKSDRVRAMLDEEKRLRLDSLRGYQEFGRHVQQVKCDVLSFLIQAWRDKKRVVAYGAPAKGNTLLNYCGVGSELLPFTVDKSTYKQGLYLPGTHIPIKSLEEIFVTKPDFLLILPWNLRQEIADQMAGIREWGGRFVVPIPKVEIF